MGTHGHAHAGPLPGDVSACGEPCGAWHGGHSRTLAGVCGGREAVTALWPPASTCPTGPLAAGLGRAEGSPGALHSTVLALLTGKELPPLQAAHLAAACR